MPLARRPRITIGLALLALLVLSIVFVRTNADSVLGVAGAITSMDWRLLGCGIVLSLIAMWNRGLLNQSAHRAVGLEPGSAEMTKTAAVGFSAQKIVRSGGLSGLAVFLHHGRGRGYDAGSVAGACLLVAAASFVALGVLMVTTIAALALTDQLTGWWMAAGVGFAIYALTTAGLVAVVVRSRPLADRLWIGAHQMVARVRRRPCRAPDMRYVDDLFSAVTSARRRPADTGRLIAHAVAGKAFGAIMLLVAASSMGVGLTPTRALIIYATALGASLISIVPGGFGVVEASTAALLVASGAAAPVAALIVALFRVFDMWLPLVAGIGVARGQLRTEATAVTEIPPVAVVPVAAAA